MELTQLIEGNLQILHLVHQFAPDHVGGTELYTQTLAQYQADRGHSVAVFYPAPGIISSAPAGAVMNGGIRVYRIPAGNRNRRQVFLNTFSQKQLRNSFANVLDLEQPDLVHIQHLMGLPFSLINEIDSRHIPYVITLHDYWYGCANAQLINNVDNTTCRGPDGHFHNCGRCVLARAGLPNDYGLGFAVAPMMAYRNHRLRNILAGAYKIIAPTQFVRQTYKEMGLPTENMIHIPHGIDVPTASIGEILSKLAPRDASQLHIGFVGSLGWQKGVHILVKAVNLLPGDQVTLSIYGDLDTFPDYVAQLRQTARHPGIHFAGRVSRDSLWQKLASCDVVVLPTLWYEVSPLTIQEVFAVNVPIIASRIGAMAEKIRDGIDGLLVEPGDVNALHSALAQLLEDPDLLARLKSGIRPVYTMQEQVIAVEAIYPNLSIN